MKRFARLFASALVAILAACTHEANHDGRITLRVGATPVPHQEILEQVVEPLRQQGIDLKIVSFNDYVQPNLQLEDGQIDANYYQTLVYLENFDAERHLKLTSMAKVHIEPFGLYSKKVANLAAVRDGAVVALPNEVTNGGRALRLLAQAGLITLRDGSGAMPRLSDVTDNPRHLTFKEMDAAMLPRVLPDVDVACINTNFALAADLNPRRDALLLEGSDAPYVNVLAVRAGDVNKPALQKLAAALTSPAVSNYIVHTYHGAVQAAF